MVGKLSNGRKTLSNKIKSFIYCLHDDRDDLESLVTLSNSDVLDRCDFDSEMTLKVQYDAVAVDENSTSVDAQTSCISSEHQTTEVLMEPIAVDNDCHILQSILNGCYDRGL